MTDLKGAVGRDVSAGQRPSSSPSPRRRQRSRRLVVWGGRGVEALVLTAVALVVMAPILWALSTSLRTPAESFNEPPTWIPLHPVFSNYTSVFDQGFGTYLINSALVTGCIVIGQLVTAALAGYAFAKLRFRGREVTFWLIIATMMVPIQSTIIPVFIMIKYMGLSDTRTALVLPVVGTAFGTFLMRQAFLQMPKDYGEAAVIDGASPWKVFSRVYLPMAGPALAALAVLGFAAYWNEFFRPLIFLSSGSKFTVPLGLVNLEGFMGTGSISVVLAGVIVALIPNLIVFGFAQRYFVRGITFGGIKG